MLKKPTENRFLSDERNETLNALSNHFSFSDNDPENVILDILPFHLMFYSFLNETKSSNASLVLSQLISTFNRNFDSIYSNNKNVIKENLYWLSTDFDFIEIIDLLYSKTDCDLLICLLQITSITENSLANIYIQKSDKVPNMLTNLLNSDILRNVLSDSFIDILSVFIGPPKSLNLRNLSWHGYLWDVNYSTIKKYSKFLVIVLWNIGKHLKENNNYEFDFQIRHKITKIPELEIADKKLQEIFLFKSSYNLNVSFDFIETILQTIDLKINERKYYESICLMLPVFEFYLRMIYIRANGLSVELSVAVCEEFFVTEDVVISEFIKVTSIRNRFIDYVGEEFATIVADIFICLDGPRIKDIISHGEVTIADHDLSSWAVGLKSLLYYSLCLYEEKVNDENFLTIQRWISNFEPQYHPLAQIKQNFINTDRQIKSLKEKIEEDLFISSKIETEEIIDILKWKFKFLNRCNEVISECGLTLKIMSNQIIHIQQQIKIVLNEILAMLNSEFDESRHFANFRLMIRELMDFIVIVSSICRKWFVSWVVESEEPVGLMKKSLVKFIKRMIKYCDKVRSLTLKHKWSEMESIFKVFFEDVLKNDC